MLLVATAGIALAQPTPPPLVQPTPPPPARTVAAAAAALFAAGDYERALDAYQRAYLDDIDEPQYLLRIAECYRALHQPSEALRFYRLYLKERPHAPERASIEASMRALAAPAPSPVPTPPAPAAVVLRAPSAPPQHAERALWRRPWLWAAIGGAVIAGVALGVGLGTRNRDGNNSSFTSTLPAFGPSSAAAGPP